MDKGNKNFQPSNLEFTSINVDNKAHNVIPARAKAQFNIRYNNLHTSSSLKKKINLVIKNMSKKYKCKYKVNYIANGDAFLTKPGKTIFMAKKIIKKITKVTPKFSTTGGTSDARFIKKISPCLEFGLVNKTMHRVDECVSLSDLKKLTKIYNEFLVEFLSENLKIKKSKIDKNGLYASQDIKKGTRIIEYKGKLSLQNKVK